MPESRTHEMTLNERLAVVESKVNQLQQVPPRVEQLHREVDVVKVGMDAIKREVHAIREAQQALLTKVDGISDQVKRLFWTGAGVMILAAFIVGVAGLANDVTGYMRNTSAIAHAETRE